MPPRTAAPASALATAEAQKQKAAPMATDEYAEEEEEVRARISCVSLNRYRLYVVGWSYYTGTNHWWSTNHWWLVCTGTQVHTVFLCALSWHTGTRTVLTGCPMCTGGGVRTTGAAVRSRGERRRREEGIYRVSQLLPLSARPCSHE
jgi:hypothetical protein